MQAEWTVLLRVPKRLLLESCATNIFGDCDNFPQNLNRLCPSLSLDTVWFKIRLAHATAMSGHR